MTPLTWTPDSWQQRPAVQQPRYRDSGALETVLSELRELPPLVVAEEVESLRVLLAEALAGKRFLLQGGDGAEAFADCRGGLIQDKLRVLLQMSVLITHGGRTGVIHLGRIASPGGWWLRGSAPPRALGSAMEPGGRRALPRNARSGAGLPGLRAAARRSAQALAHR